jgi:hypothetical protein
MNAQGGTIAMPKEAPMEPIFDKESGNLLTFSTGADGRIVAIPHKVLAGSGSASEAWKPDGNG